MKEKFKKWIHEASAVTRSTVAKAKNIPYFKFLDQTTYKADAIQAYASRARVGHLGILDQLDPKDLKASGDMMKKAVMTLDNAQKMMFEAVDKVSGVIKEEEILNEETVSKVIQKLKATAGIASEVAKTIDFIIGHVQEMSPEQLKNIGGEVSLINRSYSDLKIVAQALDKSYERMRKRK